MTTSLKITAASTARATCVIGKREENSRLKSRYGVSFAKHNVLIGLCKSLDSIFFRYVEGCWRGRSRIKFSAVAMAVNGNKYDDHTDPNQLSNYLSYFDDDDYDDDDERDDALFQPIPLFQKPLAFLKEDMDKVEEAVKETGLDFGDQINLLLGNYFEARRLSYDLLTPIQRMIIARHPNRPTVLDHMTKIARKWVELHGDGAGHDDPAIVTGLGSIEGIIYMFIGYHQRNRKENFKCNSTVPTPHSYKKALHMMKYAEYYGLPIVTFVDTTGLFDDLKSEELCQGEAIAKDLRTMFGLKVPIVTVVTGEGGSAGALLIACANKLLMMENSAFYVGSPGGCATILQKLPSAAHKEAEILNIPNHYRLKIAGGVIEERYDGAYAEQEKLPTSVELAILEAMEELRIVDTEELMRHRMLKFQATGEVGHYKEDGQVEPEKICRMKPSEVNVLKTAEIESQLEELEIKILAAEGTFDPMIIEHCCAQFFS